MIRLIKNELYKIVKKKSFIILLAIIAALLLLETYVYYDSAKDNNTDYVYYDYSEYDKYSDYSEDNKNTYKEEYTYLNANKESANLHKKYKTNSWQSYVIDREGEDIIFNYVYSKEFGTPEEKEKHQNAYNDFVKRLENDDWRYFVENSIIISNASLKTKKEALAVAKTNYQKDNLQIEINSIEFELKKLNMMIEEGIPYGRNYLFMALDELVLIPETFDEYYNMVKMDKENNISEYNAKINFQELIRSNKINEYIIENKVDVKNAEAPYEIFKTLYSSNIVLVIMFIVMVSGSIMSSEYSKGTIKGLLIRPYSRTKVLLSKFISCLLMIVIVGFSMLVFELIWSMLFFSLDSLSLPVLEYSFASSNIVSMSVIKYALLTFVNYLPMFILLLTLAFAISVIVGNTTLAVIISLLGSLVAELINAYVQYYGMTFLKYFVTPNWDFNLYSFGALSPYQGLTLTKSLIICGVYFIIMILATWIVFKKKNIKNI